MKTLFERSVNYGVIGQGIVRRDFEGDFIEARFQIADRAEHVGGHGRGAGNANEIPQRIGGQAVGGEELPKAANRHVAASAGSCARADRDDGAFVVVAHGRFAEFVILRVAHAERQSQFFAGLIA